MPDTRRTPRIAFASAVDLAEWADVEVFSRPDEEAGEGVVIPEDAGVYLDPVQASCGYGCHQSLAARLSFQWVVLGGEADAFVVAIDDADRVTIAFTDAGESYELIDTPALRLLGIPAGTGERTHGSTYTATADWTRGLWRVASGPPTITLRRVGGGTTTIDFAWAQDVRCLIRGDEADDLDTPTTDSLTLLDHTRYDIQVAWLVTDDGRHCWCARGEVGDVVWQSETFRRRFGWSGLETAVVETVSGRTITYAIADGLLPGFLIPSRPCSAMTAIQEEQSSTLRLTDGSWSSSWIGSYLSYRIEWVLDGPAGGADLHRHWLDLRRTHVHAGEPITFWLTWGDTRRAMDPALADVDQPAYDQLVTSDRGGFAGRLLCRLHPDSADETVEWRDSLRLRAHMITRLTLREDGV